MFSVFHICKVRSADYRGATECGDCSVEGGIGGICGARETGSPEDKLKCFACDRSTSTRFHSKSVCARESRLAPVLFWNYARSLDFHSNCTHPGFERTSQVVGRNTLNAADPHSTRSRDHGGKGRAHLLPSSGLEAAVRIHP